MMEEIMETCTTNNNKIEYNYLVIFNMQPLLLHIWFKVI